MARAVIRLPVGVAGPGRPLRMDCEGATVRDALADCIEREPSLKSRIFRDDGSVWVGVFVNGRNVRQGLGLDTPLHDGDELRVLPPIAGG